MPFAQLKPEHIAQQPVAQDAHTEKMQSVSPRRARRTARLRELVAGWPGGASALARVSGTPKSHISAILAGRRGIGDELAAKFEAVAKLPVGWMDQPETEIILSDAERALVLAFRAQMGVLHSPLPTPPPTAESASPQVRKSASPQRVKGTSEWDEWLTQHKAEPDEMKKRHKKHDH